MDNYRIAAVIKRSSSEEFLLVRQAPPRALEEEEYQHYVDSDLWDLPSTSLKPLEGDHRSEEVIFEEDNSLHDNLDLRMFNVDSALSQITSQLGRTTAVCGQGNWSVLKFVEEPEFGPDSPIKTLFIIGTISHRDEDFSNSCKWISKDSVTNFQLGPTPSSGRIGLLTIIALNHGSDGPRKCQLPQIFLSQVYPPGIMVVPMKSRTQRPFKTTNLVVIVADGESEESGIMICGDALLVDPGCSIQYHSDLEHLVTALPRKLIVCLTHHHNDHIDGLPVIKKCNPDAILLAHENTLSRIGRENRFHQCLTISGGEKIQIGSEKLEAVFAPGHTDGHIALFHLNTKSLIVGDHCVGQGSAVLDLISGGNMKDYFETTYKFLELSPSVLIPMHGRINLWPERMLCGYLKHRRDREGEILKAIENGAETLYDVVAGVYANVDVRLWLAASFNARLVVDHLGCRGMLPNDFSLENFKNSCDAFINIISALNNER